jgi:NADH dehydrogenase (ubiquinone) Fe-S protein 8
MAARPQTSQLLIRQSAYLLATSQFHTSTPRNATPYGEPPKGFRLPRPKRFDEGESIMDKAGNYFLLTEMFRGMYVVMEQFFRPPYAPHLHKLVQTR